MSKLVYCHPIKISKKKSSHLFTPSFSRFPRFCSQKVPEIYLPFLLCVTHWKNKNKNKLPRQNCQVTTSTTQRTWPAATGSQQLFGNQGLWACKKWVRNSTYPSCCQLCNLEWKTFCNCETTSSSSSWEVLKKWTLETYEPNHLVTQPRFRSRSFAQSRVTASQPAPSECFDWLGIKAGYKKTGDDPVQLGSNSEVRTWSCLYRGLRINVYGYGKAVCGNHPQENDIENKCNEFQWN